MTFPYFFHFLFTTYTNSIFSLYSHIDTYFSSLFLNFITKPLFTSLNFTLSFIPHSSSTFHLLFHELLNFLIPILILSSSSHSYLLYHFPLQYFLICSSLPFYSLLYLICSPCISLPLKSIPNYFCCYYIFEHTKYLTNTYSLFNYQPDLSSIIFITTSYYAKKTDSLC